MMNELTNNNIVKNSEKNILVNKKTDKLPSLVNNIDIKNKVFYELNN